METLAFDPTLIDPTPRQLRIALAVAAPSLLMAGLSAGALALDGVSHSAVLAVLSITALVVFGGAALVGFIGFLIILSSARGTARIYDRLAAGDGLADWRFDPAEWDAWLASERERDPWSLTALLGCAALVVAIGGWAISLAWADAKPADRIVDVLIVAGLVVAVAAVFRLGRWTGRRRVSAMRDRPRVTILDDAVYCGGRLRQWNAHMIVLRRVEVVTAGLTQLEVTIGANNSLKTASTVLGLVAVVGGQGGSTVGSADTVFRVPVPGSKAGEAADLARKLMAAQDRSNSRATGPDRRP